MTDSPAMNAPRAADASVSRRARGLLLAAFFLSGAAGLTYEIVWSRSLLVVLGHTASTSALLLSLFVGSLGVGAWWAGPKMDQLGARGALRKYIVFELAAALIALASPWLVQGLTPIYVSLASGHAAWIQWPLRLLIAGLSVVPCALLLGATLPAMVVGWNTSRGQAGRSVGWLYGVNTLGAVLGCLGTGLVAMELLGVIGALGVGVGLGFLAAACAYVASRCLPADASVVRAESSSLQAEASSSSTNVQRNDAKWLALVCGFVGLGCEIAGFRILVFFLEGFTAAFASMLGVFIAGIGVGSILLSPVLTGLRHPRRALAGALLAFGLVALAAVYLLLPQFEPLMRDIKAGQFRSVQGPGDIAAALRSTALIGAAVLLFVPAVILGTTFPLCVKLAESEGARPGGAVGATYLFNSLGTLLAPLVCTFLLIPFRGVLATWGMVSLLALALGVMLLMFRRVPLWALGLALLASAALPLPATDASQLVSYSAVMHGREGRVVHQVETDATTTASVVDLANGERYLYTDDFPAAATGASYRYMRMLGHLPCLLAPTPNRVMVIAFGTGTTAGAVAAHDAVKELTVVEVSKSVLNAAEHFKDANRHVLDDPRVRVVTDDGRNALLLHQDPLDVITLEPLMPYSPHGLPFYTREFYELCRDRLAPDGIVCQWVPVHAMPAPLYAAFLRTFFEVFPDGSLWFFEQSTALIGRKSAGVYPSQKEWDRRVAALASELSDAGFTTPTSLSAAYLANGTSILKLPAPGIDASDWRPIRDWDPYPEFRPTPRARLNTPYLHKTMAYLATLVEPNDVPTGESWWPQGADREVRKATRTALASRWRDAEAQYLSVSLRALPPGHPNVVHVRTLRDEALANAADGYARALQEIPGNTVLAWRRVRALRRQAVSKSLALLGEAGRKGQTSERKRRVLMQAERMLEASLPPLLNDQSPVATERYDVLKVYVAALLRRGRCEHAREAVAANLQVAWPPSTLTQIKALHELLKEHGRGVSPKPTESLAWLFKDAAPCGEPVAQQLDAVLALLDQALVPQDGSPKRRLHLAAKRVYATASALGFSGRRAAAKAINERIDAAPSADLRAPLAALHMALDPASPLITSMLASEDDAARRFALRELEPWKLTSTLLSKLTPLATHADKETRRGLAQLAARELYRVPLVRAVLPLLNDGDVDVRKEAWSALIRHKPDLIKDYDPRASAKKRREVIQHIQSMDPELK